MTSLGIDVGTSSLKIVAVDERGRLAAQASAAYETRSPEPGWSEQPPDDWWNACRAALIALGTRADLANVTAIGLTGQMHGAVLLDGDGEVIRPAILWNDQRTSREAAEIEASVGVDRVVRLTGNRSFTGFTAPKLLWVRRNQTIAYKRIQHLLLPKDYIRWKLTGEAATDVSDASGTGLFDVGERRWSEAVLDELNLNTDILPPAHESIEATGNLRDDVADDLGLPKRVPVVAGAGDQAAGAVGAGAVRPGVSMISLGTSGVLFAPAAAYAPDAQGRLHTFCSAVPGQWHTMGVMLTAGVALRWLADAVLPLMEGDPFERVCGLAAASPAGARGLLFAPYLQGERMPHNDPDVRAAFVGLAMHHDIGDMARAVMEGVAFNLRAMRDLATVDGVPASSLRLIGGGARVGTWRQIVADVFESPVDLLATDEGPAYGAALLAATGAGVYPSVREAATACVAPSATVEPRPETRAAYAEAYGRFRELYGRLR